MNYIGYAFTSPPEDRQLYDDLVKIRQVLGNQIIARSQIDENRISTLLEAPISTLQYLPAAQLDLRPDSAEALVSASLRMRGTFLKNNQSSDQTLVNMTALYSICNTVIFYMSSSYDISKHFPINPDLFQKITKTLYSK